MGICCSDGIPKGTASDQAINSKINKLMKTEEANQSFIHRIILLGPGDSGKTTVLKQIRKTHTKPEHNDRNPDAVDSGFIPVIRERVMGYMKLLCEQSIKLNIDIEEKNHDLRDYFLHDLPAPFGNHFNDENVSKIKQLWNDEGIKETFHRRNEYQNRIPDNAEYFLSQRIEAIASKQYHVTFDDYLRIRMRTSGFMSEIFKKELHGAEHQFVFTDVGGQRSERTKWINMVTDDIDVVLYIIAISEFDINCFEDNTTNRLDEALNLFKTIIDKGFCNGKTVQLFFNKFDLFSKKLADPNAKTIDEFHTDFPKDADPRNEDDVVKYVTDRFKKIYEEGVEQTDVDKKVNQLHYHRTSALDTNQINEIAHALETDLIKNRLRGVGF